jgi:predicted glycosyltransferase
VLVTAGSGEEGYRLTDSYISFLETLNGGRTFQSHIVYSPQMPAADKHALNSRVERMPGISVHQFHHDLDSYLHGATALVSMSGYNTCCQILSYRKRAVVVPRQSSSSSQLRRAETFQRYGVATMVHPERLTPEHLGQEILKQIGRKESTDSRDEYKAIPLTGLNNIARRVIDLCGIPLRRHAAMSLAGELA